MPAFGLYNSHNPTLDALLPLDKMFLASAFSSLSSFTQLLLVLNFLSQSSSSPRDISWFFPCLSSKACCFYICFNIYQVMATYLFSQVNIVFFRWDPPKVTLEIKILVLSNLLEMIPGYIGRQVGKGSKQCQYPIQYPQIFLFQNIYYAASQRTVSASPGIRVFPNV